MSDKPDPINHTDLIIGDGLSLLGIVGRCVPIDGLNGVSAMASVVGATMTGIQETNGIGHWGETSAADKALLVGSGAIAIGGLSSLGYRTDSVAELKPGATPTDPATAVLKSVRRGQWAIPVAGGLGVMGATVGGTGYIVGNAEANQIRSLQNKISDMNR